MIASFTCTYRTACGDEGLTLADTSHVLTVHAFDYFDARRAASEAIDLRWGSQYEVGTLAVVQVRH